MKLSSIVALLSTVSWVSCVPFSSLRASRESPDVSLNIDHPVSESLETMQPRLEHALMINKTQYAEDLIEEMERFKDAVVRKMQFQLAEALAQAKLAGITSEEELHQIANEIKQKWDHLIRVEIKQWSEKELKAWAQKTEKAWVGVETPVVDKIRQFLDFLESHTPGRESTSYDVALVNMLRAILTHCSTDAKYNP